MSELTDEEMTSQAAAALPVWAEQLKAAIDIVTPLLADKLKEEITEVIADAQYCLAQSECTFIDESLRELWQRRRLRILAFYWESP